MPTKREITKEWRAVAALLREAADCFDDVDRDVLVECGMNLAVNACVRALRLDRRDSGCVMIGVDSPSFEGGMVIDCHDQKPAQNDAPKGK